MNLCVLTCRIISRPQLIRHKRQVVVHMMVSLCNNKKGMDFYNIIAIAKNKIASQVFDIYRKGDFVVIEGSLKIKLKRVSYNNKIFKNRKLVNIQINKIHPTNYTFKFYS